MVIQINLKNKKKYEKIFIRSNINLQFRSNVFR